MHFASRCKCLPYFFLIQIKEESAAFEALIKWTSWDLASRKQLFPRLFKQIRLQLISPQYLASTVRFEVSVWILKTTSGLAYLQFSVTVYLTPGVCGCAAGWCSMSSVARPNKVLNGPQFAEH